MIPCLLTYMLGMLTAALLRHPPLRHSGGKPSLRQPPQSNMMAEDMLDRTKTKGLASDRDVWGVVDMIPVELEDHLTDLHAKVGCVFYFFHSLSLFPSSHSIRKLSVIVFRHFQCCCLPLLVCRLCTINDVLNIPPNSRLVIFPVSLSLRLLTPTHLHLFSFPNHFFKFFFFSVFEFGIIYNKQHNNTTRCCVAGTMRTRSTT